MPAPAAAPSKHAARPREQRNRRPEWRTARELRRVRGAARGARGMAARSAHGITARGLGLVCAARSHRLGQLPGKTAAIAIAIAVVATAALAAAQLGSPSATDAGRRDAGATLMTELIPVPAAISFTHVVEHAAAVADQPPAASHAVRVRSKPRPAHQTHRLLVSSGSASGAAPAPVTPVNASATPAQSATAGGTSGGGSSASAGPSQPSSNNTVSAARPASHSVAASSDTSASSARSGPVGAGAPFGPGHLG